ncbi:D-glycerate dehydrogenase [Alicyclobacillus contaminans]|uniref:2-hydroxyacid dehydrogenase n=1 Tax=Alicyclobacillus contaminans TaxID=392016 RepID=UPI00041617A5|nr:D-glycerate dehydrogenase [Alicyclobacillus contaminans]GMA49839.1 D-glycerate dehydrogenase [Alicyclobacillus contaminans]
MASYKVVVTGRILPSALEVISRRCAVQRWEEATSIPRELLYEWVKDADGLFTTGDVRVDDELLAHAPKLRVISQASVGYDNVDIDACTRRGIPFGNTPGVLVDATADLAFGLVLCAARRIFEGAAQVRNGAWKNGYDIPYGVDLFGKTLGIVGMGSIGAAVAKRAQASGMRVIYHNRRKRSDDAVLGTTYSEFDALLESSDFVLVLAPLTNESRGMFGKEQFARMKPTAYFVNVARGAVVDTDALYEALKTKQIAYAALDVTDPEPLPGDHPLLTLGNVLITPHIGSATHETRHRMALLAAENLMAGLDGKPLPACVNGSVNYRG